MRIKVPATLNSDNFEHVIEDFQAAGHSRLALDLSNLDFIEPYGLVGLVSVVQYLTQIGREIQLVRVPWRINSYLRRMNVYAAIEEYDSSVTPTRSFVPSPLRPLLEVTKIDFTHGFNEFVGVGNLLGERMGEMLSRDDQYPASVVNYLTTSILEVCQNIEHSRTWGYVAAQKYSRWGQAVKVGVMDLGIGISESLKPRYRNTGQKWSDRKALSLAITPTYTARPSGSGGLGLFNVIDYIKEHHGCDFSLLFMLTLDDTIDGITARNLCR